MQRKNGAATWSGPRLPCSPPALRGLIPGHPSRQSPHPVSITRKTGDESRSAD
ncbi:hypothetical protein GbCGDNIH6_8287 [Granulibacter bethesdensis]|nr:hypothetical protein GbCGDNIH6_8287 [Granulibacter bethesdensis]